MKVSTEINSLSRKIGEAKAIEMYAKAGFDAYDLSTSGMVRFDWANNKLLENDHPFMGNEYVKYMKELKNVANGCGIVCNQSHAPFPTRCKAIRDLFKRAIECTAIVGGKICIVHPDNDKSAEENAEMYYSLLPFAKEHGVKIATENMWNWNSAENHAAKAACSDEESFIKHVDTVGDEYLVGCLDIGHAEMAGLNTSAVKMIYALGDRIEALHIHDNDKRNDSHQIPFSMNIEFSPIVKALKDIGYKGYFTLECDAYLGKFGGELEDGVKNLYNAVRRLADEFEAL